MPNPNPKPHLIKGPSLPAGTTKNTRSRLRPTLLPSYQLTIPSEDGEDIDVTLSSSSKGQKIGRRGLRDTDATTHIRNKYEIEHEENIDHKVSSTPSPAPSSTQGISADMPNHHLQPARPRLVGAVVRHLGGRPQTPSRSSSKPRWLARVKDRPPHVDDSDNAQPNNERRDPTPLVPVSAHSTFPSSTVIPASPTVYAPATTATPSAPSKPPIAAPAEVAHHNPLPDLSRVANPAVIASMVATPPSSIGGRPATRPFSLHAPVYTDDDIPIPEPYNAAYPHPLTAYASPGVNPETVKRSGYGDLLDKMVKEDLPSAMGTIFFQAGATSLESSVYLLFSFEGGVGNGNGIPESLWSKLENTNASRLPVGVAGISPFVPSDSASTAGLPPRFAQLNAPRSNSGILTPASPTSGADYFTIDPRHSHSRASLTPPADFDPTPRPSPDFMPIKHAASAGQLRVPRYSTEPQLRAPLNARPNDRFWAGQDIEPSRRGAMHDYNLARPKDHEHPAGVSPFYKTEMCAMWEQVGSCKYGGQCQYAHGHDDLRVPRHLQRAMPQSLPPHAQSHRVDNVPRRMPAGPPAYEFQERCEPRRASCPPQQLFRLWELAACEGVASPLPLPYRRGSDIVPPPIGAERSTTLPTVNNGIRHFSTHPASPLSSEPRRSLESSDSVSSFTMLRSEPSTLSLSLSTSSGSRLSMFSNCDDYESRDGKYDAISPIEGDITITEQEGLRYPHGHGMGFGVALGGSGSGSGDNVAGSPLTLVDFSTGKSIWR